MRDPDVKARILAEQDVVPEDAGSMEMFAAIMAGAADFLFGLDDVVDYEPAPERSFGAIAAARGRAGDRSGLRLPRGRRRHATSCRSRARATCTVISTRSAR